MTKRRARGCAKPRKLRSGLSLPRPEHGGGGFEDAQGKDDPYGENDHPYVKPPVEGAEADQWRDEAIDLSPGAEHDEYQQYLRDAHAQRVGDREAWENEQKQQFRAQDMADARARARSRDPFIGAIGALGDAALPAAQFAAQQLPGVVGQVAQQAVGAFGSGRRHRARAHRRTSVRSTGRRYAFSAADLRGGRHGAF